MEIKKLEKHKWYISTEFISLIFAFSIFIIPFFIGIILLIKKRKQDKCTYENVNRSLDDYNKYINEYNIDSLISVENKKKEIEIEQETVKNQMQKEKQIVENQIENLNNIITQLNSTENEKRREISKLNKEISELKTILGNLENDIELSEYGIYKPIFSFETPEAYKANISSIVEKQKKAVKTDLACSYPTTFTLDGSLSKGKKLIKDNVKQILRSFNNECDVLISKVKYNNIDTIKNRIVNSFNSLNKLNEKIQIRINSTYLDLKILELHAYYEYERKKQDDKEKAKEEREKLREEAKLLKEIEEKRKFINKEKTHYQNALIKITEQLKSNPNNKEFLDKKLEIENELEEIEKSLKDIDYREANKRAGYVYIISNIGSFGENIYKIGMTRRLEPIERINELGDASVPFNFDVHAMIFSDDAPSLENALHHAFENKKVNMINPRREFFKVTLEEIEEVVKNNYDKTVDFIRVAEAEQYRESKKLYK